jgi:hypothetical protein
LARRSQQVAGAQGALPGPAEALLVDGIGEDGAQGGKVALDVHEGAIGRVVAAAEKSIDPWSA